jgi:hypothetical protein
VTVSHLHSLLANGGIDFSGDNPDFEGLFGMPKAIVLGNNRTRIQVQILLTTKSILFSMCLAVEI